MTKLLNTTDLLNLFNISRSSFRSIAAQPNFPKPVLLNKKKVWRETDIEAWVASL